MARNSEVVATLAVTAAASTVLASAPVAVPRYDQIVIVADVQGVGGVALDLYLEESWDGGTTWFEVAHLTQLAAGAAAQTLRIVPGLQASNVAVLKDTLSPAANGVLAAGTVLPMPWGPILRIVSRTAAGAPSGGSITQTFRFEQWQEIAGR